MLSGSVPVSYPPGAPPLRVVDAAGHAVPLYEPPYGQPDSSPWIGLDALMPALSISALDRTRFIATSGLFTMDQGDVPTISPGLAALYIHNARRFGFISADHAKAVRAALEIKGTLYDAA